MIPNGVKPNRIIMHISHIHHSPAAPWKVMYTISLWNELDNINTFPNINSEEYKDYKESEELITILENSRALLLKTKHPHIDLVTEEYDII